MIDPSLGLGVVALAILAIGAILGLVSRLLLRLVHRPSHLTIAGSVLAGIVGAVIGSGLTHVVTGIHSEPRDAFLLAFGVVGTIAVLLVAERFVRQTPPAVTEVIEAGESAGVEFKSTARHNLRTGRRDDKIEAVVAKTVAGFLNSAGGTLLVGVDDAGVVLGLDDDMQHMKAPDVDRYELWIHDFLTRVLGAPAVSGVRVSFPSVGGRTICRIDVARSSRPVFVRPPRTDQVRFYARIGNSTRDLSVAEAIDYAVDHFHRPWFSPRRRRA
jgi:uncharacterized membrane protein YeaQ/YmgE (transglycosylase-associated protein family)